MKNNKQKYNPQKDLENQKTVGLIISLIVAVLGYFFIIRYLFKGALGIGIAIFCFFMCFGLVIRMSEKQVADRTIINKRH